MKLTFYKNRQALINSDVVKHLQLSDGVIELYASFSYDDRTRVLTIQLYDQPTRKSIKLHGQRSAAGKIYNFVFCPTSAFQRVGINAENLIGEKLDVHPTSNSREFTVTIPTFDEISKNAAIRRRVKEIMRKLCAIDREYLAQYLTKEAGYDKRS